MRLAAGMLIGLLLASLASAGVFVTAYRCDGKTPLTLKDPNLPGVYEDIMVGTRLVLVVRSDENWSKIEPGSGGKEQWRAYGWWGALWCDRDSWNHGKLLGRGYDPDTLQGSYLGSCLPATGSAYYPSNHIPTAIFRNGLKGIGFDLVTLEDATAGDWFVFDYVAESVGTCKVKFMDRWVSSDVPQETLVFNHVPSQDNNGDGIVSFPDFASLASRWRQPGEGEADSFIDPSGLAMFADHWLVRTECSAATTEPNAPDAGP